MQSLAPRRDDAALRQAALLRSFEPSTLEPGARDDDRDPRRHRAIWISDTHLGTRGCRSDLLLEFLQRNECDDLYLVGDIIDGWSLRKGWYWTDEQNRILQEILRKSSSGTRVTYVCGNHDEFLRDFLGLMIGNVPVVDEAIHVTAEGKRLLILHGDRFDVAIRHARWLVHLGDRAYQAALVVNRWFNAVRRRLGKPYWSLSAYLKERVKNAVSYIESFEDAVLDEARARGYDGVVAGHIHKAEIKDSDGVLYCNDGDWVESCTALVESPEGSLSIVAWAEEREREERRLTPVETPVAPAAAAPAARRRAPSRVAG